MARRAIPLSAPRVEGNAWKYIKDCLDTDWVSSVGRYVDRFEESVARFCGARHAVAGVNGTACLHAALTAMGVGPGDAVVVPALTFIATANAVTYCGASPLLLDCEPVRFNLDVDLLADFLEKRCVRRKSGLFTRVGGLRLKVLLPAHILGFPADMKRIVSLAEEHGLVVLEDAAESIGSFIAGRHTGTFGRAGVLSFNGNKIVTCGGGGAVLTDDAALAKHIRHLTRQAKSAEAEYIHDEIGYNYRLTNIPAALGLSQMELLPERLREREQLSRWYRERLRGVPVELVGSGVRWNRWLLSAQAATPKEKDRLLKALNDGGCQARSLWRPVPLQKPYRHARAEPIANAERAYATVINIPSSTGLDAAQIDRVARILEKAELTRLLV